MKANLSGQNNIKTQPKNHFRNIAISITLIVLISIAGRFFGETWGYFAGNLDKQELIAFSAGEISGNSYHNDYIGLSFNLPENWCFRTDEEISALMNVQDVMYDKEFEHPK